MTLLLAFCSDQHCHNVVVAHSLLRLWQGRNHARKRYVGGDEITSSFLLLIQHRAQQCAAQSETVAEKIIYFDSNRNNSRKDKENLFEYTYFSQQSRPLNTLCGITAKERLRVEAFTIDMIRPQASLILLALKNAS
ncbi:unnamed protein product [Amoebophrya sp. A120]|nr:unnamed protein product [Amoebophrya sp. A120]|eukprot:GSA120T00009099001.1